MHPSGVPPSRWSLNGHGVQTPWNKAERDVLEQSRRPRFPAGDGGSFAFEGSQFTFRRARGDQRSADFHLGEWKSGKKTGIETVSVPGPAGGDAVDSAAVARGLCPSAGPCCDTGRGRDRTDGRGCRRH